MNEIEFKQMYSAPSWLGCGKCGRHMTTSDVKNSKVIATCLNYDCEQKDINIEYSLPQVIGKVVNASNL